MLNFTSGEQPQNSKDELLSSGSKRKTKSKIFNPNSHSGTQGERNDSRWNPVTNPLNLNRRGYVNRACIYRATAKEGNHLQIKKLTMFISRICVNIGGGVCRFTQKAIHLFNARNTNILLFS